MSFTIPTAVDGLGVPFAPPQYPAGNGADKASMDAPAPGKELQKCGLVAGDKGSMWMRTPAEGKCRAFSPDFQDKFELPVSVCNAVPKEYTRVIRKDDGAPEKPEDLTYKYTVGGCEAGWEVGPWGARQPVAPARLGLNRVVQQQHQRPAMGPKHFQ